MKLSELLVGGKIKDATVTGQSVVLEVLLNRRTRKITLHSGGEPLQADVAVVERVVVKEGKSESLDVA
jgi:hypothetical protein